MLGITSLSYASYLLGFMHGLDTDHVIEVTDFVSQDPRPMRALKFGLKFGIGHTSTVLILGLLALSLKFAVPAAFGSTFEIISGILLILLGIWSIYRRFRMKAYGHNHSHGIGFQHPHTHSQLDHTVFKYGPIFTGIVTGMAGTAGVMIFGPVAAAKSLAVATAFILLYGAGVISAMLLYGLAISRVFGLTNGSGKIARIITIVTGTMSIALGVVWISRAAGGLMLILQNIK